MVGVSVLWYIEEHLSRSKILLYVRQCPSLCKKPIEKRDRRCLQIPTLKISCNGTIMAVVLTYYIIDCITDFNPFMHNFEKRPHVL